MKNERHLQCVSKDKWLDLLVEKKTCFSINTCRYDCRNFDWVLPWYRMEEHLLIWVEQGFLGMTLPLSRDGQKTASPQTFRSDKPAPNVRKNSKDKRIETVKIEPGTMVWIPPGGSRELWGRKGQLGLHHYKIRFNIWRTKEEFISTKESLVRRNAWSMFPYFQLMVDEKSPDKAYHDHTMKSLICAMSAAFFQLPETVCAKSEKTLTSSQRSALNRFLEVNIQAGLQPRDLSEHLGLSLDYFSRVFKTTYEVSPREYIKRQRIHYAANCLAETTISVKELAYELSYNNVNLFCRQFKDVMKMTPSQYRSCH